MEILVVDGSCVEILARNSHNSTVGFHLSPCQTLPRVTTQFTPALKYLELDHKVTIFSTNLSTNHRLHAAMPPQVTRQPTHSEQTARRPTHQQLSRKRSVIEIDDDAAASDSEVAGPAESHSNSQSQSQGQASVNQLEKLMESMTNDVSTRR
jgi:hypothetical protein